MPSLTLILAAAGLMAASGLPACLLPPRSRAGQVAATALMAGAAVLGLAGLAPVLSGTSPSASLSAPWNLPWGGLSLGVDPLGAIFLALVLLVPALGSVFGLGYWRAAAKPRSSRRLGLAYGLLSGAMVLVVCARDGALFLIAWEAMALAAYFAATAEEGPETRRAGWIYLIATHLGTLCLFAMFALWRAATGSLSLGPAQAIR